ncbi:class I SAM-dependent methyltransferase [Kiloniella litopenaei]|uniref:class I SAM-dependent methyltransferase n=1 Tax=Kiloniella litopenaei TaxID=1549748 RepID=UPI003BAA6804
MLPYQVKNTLTRMFFTGDFFEILSKIKNRMLYSNVDKISKENERYLEEAQSISGFIERIDPVLARETKEKVEEIRKNGKEILDKIDFDLGGGGAYDLLYFLIRYLKPAVVVETGVASGFSSYASLEALEANKYGMLYSSDFPYFRLENPEQYIGVIVPKKLKENWKLYIKGDRQNLPSISSQIKKIDIFHYDSDKSYNGRKYAMSSLADKFTQDSVIIMDDIQNNDFFFDYVRKNKIDDVFIFEFEGKYLGVWGGSNFMQKLTEK